MNETQRSGEQSLHTPVLLDRCIALLASAIGRPGAVVVDATLGLGGHSAALLKRFPYLRLVGIDRDPAALDHSRRRLAPAAERIHLVHAVYDELPAVLAELGLPNVDGVLFDLGVSSMQLDFADRGFSYNYDAALDMRMNPSDPLTAADIVNTYSEVELTRILREFGEERFAQRISAAIVAARASQPFTTAARLVELIRNAIPAATRRTGGHPAKRTFQALRIEVNSELSVLQRAIPAAMDSVNVGGRVVVMSYQSLEDRIVKRAFAQRSKVDLPPDLPVVPAGLTPEFKLVTRGAEQPSESEISANPRAASAKLRAVERLRSAA